MQVSVWNDKAGWWKATWREGDILCCERFKVPAAGDAPDVAVDRLRSRLGDLAVSERFPRTGGATLIAVEGRQVIESGETTGHLHAPDTDPSRRLARRPSAGPKVSTSK